MFGFPVNALLQNNPSFKSNTDPVYCQLLVKFVKFWKYPVYNFRQVLHFLHPITIFVPPVNINLVVCEV